MKIYLENQLKKYNFSFSSVELFQGGGGGEREGGNGNWQNAEGLTEQI